MVWRMVLDVPFVANMAMSSVEEIAANNC